MKRQIVHVDMDAFFAAVEQRDNPAYRAKPVIVGSDPQGRGVVSTASYEARKFGIHSAMPIGEAYRRCPHGIFLRPDMKKYVQASEEIYRIFKSISPVVEMVSLDEAFIDLTGTERLWGSSFGAAVKVKQMIKETLSLTASVGIAPNKFIAKIASDLQKPDGLVEVKAEEVLDFLAPLSVRKMWGVGKKTSAKLKEIGIVTITQLRNLEESALENIFGSQGRNLYMLARGEDASPVVTERPIKSLGREKTFSEDIKDSTILEGTLLNLIQEIGWRLRLRGLEGRTVMLKLRDSSFKTITHQKKLDRSTNLDIPLYHTALELFRERWRGGMIRLVGVTVTDLRLEGTGQMEFFSSEKDSSEDELMGAIDKVRQKYGYASITRARTIKKNGRKS